jgi:hypothetical protein
MNKDDIDKVETLIGYLEYCYKQLLFDRTPDELKSVIDEAKEWIEEIKKQQL